MVRKQKVDKRLLIIAGGVVVFAVLVLAGMYADKIKAMAFGPLIFNYQKPAFTPSDGPFPVPRPKWWDPSFPTLITPTPPPFEPPGPGVPIDKSPEV